MILYNRESMKHGKRERPSRTIHLSIDEKPSRPIYVFRKAKDRVKFIRSVEALIRKSSEYKDLIKFIKDKMDMRRCVVLKNLYVANGKRYSIELHHEPFTLFDLVETILNKYEADDMKINPYMIADEVMELHYDEQVGLIPLSVTMHELVHNDEIFIPLQYVYQNYNQFYEQYHEFINPKVLEKIERKATLSLECDTIQSDVLDTEFVYVEVDGFAFPQIPTDWKDIMSVSVAERVDEPGEDPSEE